MAETSNINPSELPTGADVLETLTYRVGTHAYRSHVNETRPADEQVDNDPLVQIPINEGVFVYNCFRDRILTPDSPHHVTPGLTLTGQVRVEGQAPRDALLSFNVDQQPFADSYTLSDLPANP